MQITAFFRDIDLQAHAQSLRLWVLEILAWLAAAIGFRDGRMALKQMQREARGELRDLIFAMMCARMRFVKREGRIAKLRPHSAPRGFRYAWRPTRVVRIYTRGIALKTFREMQAALNDLDRVVACALARVPERKCACALVAVAPPACVFAPCAPAPAPDGADTS